MPRRARAAGPGTPIDGALRCKAGKGGTIYHQDELGDFVVQLEIQIPAGANNGLAIRYPGEGDPAYAGMCELQVLDDNYDKIKGQIDPRQAHGSAYGMVAAARGYHRPNGQWNFQEVIVHGSRIRVELNGTTILDADLSILGSTPERYQEYTEEVRREYEHVPDAFFRGARAAILDHFLARPRLYASDAFYARFERQARENMARELSGLSPTR